MGLLNALFSSDTATKTLAQGVDEIIYTPEEKAGFFLNLLAAYEPFKLAQRFLSLIVTIPYVTVWVFSAFMFAASIFFDPCLADQVCKSSQLIDVSTELATWNNEVLGLPTALILGFYFGGGAVEGVVRQFIEK